MPGRSFASEAVSKAPQNYEVASGFAPRNDAQGVPARSSCCPFLCLRARHFALSSVIASRVFFALFLVIASLAFLSGEAISLSVPKAGHCELVVSFAKQSPSSLCGNTGLLRAFGPRNDEQKESLRASFVRLAKQSHFSGVITSSFFRLRSNLRDSSPLCGFGMTEERVTARSSFRLRSSLNCEIASGLWPSQ
jgi:hypothetical protein